MTKNAMITIAGRPNVGKSTLTNALVGEKIAIVSNKPQTTRGRITGVVARGETQFVFMDTPGFHRARTRLGEYMDKVVRESVADVDAVAAAIDKRSVREKEERQRYAEELEDLEWRQAVAANLAAKEKYEEWCRIHEE